MSRTDVMKQITSARVLAVVRTQQLPDAAELCAALVRGGIPAVELTFTTPDLPSHLARAAATSATTGAVVGAGTVLTADQAWAAVDSGAEFLVTPGVGPEAAQVVRIAHDADGAGGLGALTPSEVMTAAHLGADAVKIFPAHRFGPGYLKDLRGPFPDLPFVPSGGITAENARDFLEAGAVVVCAGSSVVSATDVAAGSWDSVTAKARAFCASLT